jgi:hypothetical protein
MFDPYSGYGTRERERGGGAKGECKTCKEVFWTGQKDTIIYSADEEIYE